MFKYVFIAALISTSLYGAPHCPTYEVNGHLQCPKQQKNCRLIIRRGTLSESFIEVEKKHFNTDPLNESYVRANVFFQSKKDFMKKAILTSLPLRIAIPDNSNVIKISGDGPCQK